jgi:hypothetical protein
MVKILLLFIGIVIFAGWVDRLIMIGRFRRDATRSNANQPR